MRIRRAMSGESAQGSDASGRLFVVGTPIGNLDDLSPRVAGTLERVRVCFAEDTRRTGRLLDRLGTRPTLRSLFAHNEQGRVDEILARLQTGEDVAIVSDAGTPTVSDPGARVIDAALEAGVTVVPIPGPSAVSVALSASGLPADRYLFLGFAPRKGSERERWLSDVEGSRVTVVVFEAPGRLPGLLESLARRGLGDRRAVVCRELTKIHEEVRAGTISELATVYGEQSVKGEVTVVIAGRADDAAGGPDPEEVACAVEELVRAGIGRREIADTLRERFGLSRNDAYRMSLPGRGPTDG